jgi:vancomycin permeability regulator SanA
VAASLARGVALFIGGFTLVNCVGLVRDAAFDANVWWIAVPYVPGVAAAVLLAAAGVAFAMYGVAPRMAAWRRWLTVALLAFAAAVAVYDAVDFYRVWQAGQIAPGVPVPLSAVIAVLLVYVLWAVLRDPSPRGWPAVAVLCAAAAACALAFPVAQVFFFGTTDYRRPADVAVVFGAQVHDDGRPSTALRERMATAEVLYKTGLVKRLLVSGGVGASGYNEALVMRDMAVKAGVPVKDVVVDSNGVSTDATVSDTLPFFGGKGWERILAVSQYYHLPRIKLAYAGAGWDVLTVPAPATERTLPMVVREIPAFWVYYLRAIFG